MIKEEGLGYKIFKVLNYLFLTMLAFTMIFPYLNTLAKSLNEGVDTAKGGIVFLPRVFTLDNFKTILAGDMFFTSAGVTIARVVIGTILSVIVQFAAGYALTKKAFPLKGIIVTMFIIPMFISAGQIPLYLLYSNMGLLNNFWVYILPTMFSFYNAVIIRTFIQSTIPEALQESAFIDGANEITIFFKIILPLCTPILMTVGLWVMVAHWNDWTTTLYYIRDNTLFTMQYVMMELVKESERAQKMVAEMTALGGQVTETKLPTSEALISAQIIVTTLPIVCVYPFIQKYFVSGIVMGSVKG